MTLEVSAGSSRTSWSTCSPSNGSRKALTFRVCFKTAQFKLHFQKLARRTYLIPPPSAVAGLFCAILGVPREEMKKFCRERGVLAGAELLSLEGYYVTVSRIFKFDRNDKELVKLLEEWVFLKPSGERDLADVYKDVVGLMPIKESEELFRPSYKFAIAADGSVVDEGLRRIRELDFEYDVFGGNDYHFVEYIGDVRVANLTKGREGGGYCPVDYVQSIKAQSCNVVFDTGVLLKRSSARTPVATYALVGPEMERLVFVYGATIVTKNDVDVVQDGESSIFVYESARYMIP